MESTKVAGTIVTLSFRACIMVLVILFTILFARRSYGFGVSIFHEYSMMELTGEEKIYYEVTIPENVSNMQIAETMVASGLVQDKWLFYVQLMLSDHKVSSKSDPILPGKYILHTGMKPTDMMETMSKVPETKDGK